MTTMPVFDTVVVPPPPPPAVPTVDIKANGSDGPITIAYNSAATLSWTSANATSCNASGSWTGAKALNGSQSTGNLISNKNYVITCIGPGGSATDNVTVNVEVAPLLPTVDIKANNSDGPITIDYGTGALLGWMSTNATSCVASGSWSGSKPINGSESTGPLISSKTYIITCINSVGSATDRVLVNVTAPPILPTVDIKANGSDGPISVSAETQFTLSWNSQNAISCSASGGWSGPKPINGSELRSGIAGTSFDYVITCINSTGQSATDVVRVTVNQVNLPTVDIKANGSDGPITIAYNSAAVLSWTSANATSCNASGSWTGSKTLSGSESTGNLTSARTYTINCQNSSGSASDSVTVNVQSDSGISVTLTANPTVVNQGGSSTLSWTSVNAAFCYADGGSWGGNKSIPSGSEVINNLQSTRTFGITCVNSQGQSAHADATVTVTQIGITPSVTIYASPNPVQSGSQSRLFWNSSNAVSCQASGGPWSGTKNINGDEYTQALYNATTFSITCQSSTGQTVTAQTTVTITTINQSPTLNFYANPSVVPYGNYSTLYWTSTNADYCIASGDYSTNWSGNKQINGNQSVGPINVVQNYIMTCYGPGGSVTRNTTVSPQGVVIGTQPPTLTIYAIPTPVQYGGSSVVYWNSQNTDSCFALGNWYGNKTVTGQYPTGPLFADSTYTLTCYGTGGTITRSAVVPVIAPPVYVPPPTCPPGGCVAGITGSYRATIEKLIENLATPGSIGATVTARPGNELRYTITVRNTGTLTLTNLVVKDPLSDRVEIKNISDSGSYDYTNRTVTWKISRLAPSESKTLTLLVRVIQCDTDIVIENRAYLTNSQISEVSSAPAVAGVYTGAVTVTIDNSQPSVTAGDKVTYTIRYRNDGNQAVHNAKLDVYIPSGMIIEGYTQTCTISGNTVSLVIGDIAPGQAGQVVVNAKVDGSVLAGEVLTTRATVSYRDNSGVTRESSGTTISMVNGGGIKSNNSDNSDDAGTSSLRFLPDTFFGWLLLLLLIIVLAIFIKRLLSKEETIK